MPGRRSKKIEQGLGEGLGRALIKSKSKNRRNYKTRDQEQAVDVSATRIADPKANAASGLQSIIEQDDVSHFFAVADLAQREFISEKLTPEVLIQYPSHAELVNADGTWGSMRPVLTAEELRDFTERLVCVPRRPKWADGLCETAEEFQTSEQLAFHDWLARLSMFETDTGMALTPYERNIEVWRQLWRVLERSHVVVQIVDARNPLLFRCEDLDRYVKELDDGKKSTLLLLNKADLLSNEQRRIWYDYFKSKDINVLFYSALDEKGSDHVTRISVSEKSEEGASVISEDRAVYKEPNLASEKSKFDAIAIQDEAEESTETEQGVSTEEGPLKNAQNEVVEKVEKEPSQEDGEKNEEAEEELKQKVPEQSYEEPEKLTEAKNPWDILNSDGLVAEMERLCEEKYGGTLLKNQKYVIGLCGFPNVGKSSTLNSLVGSKKVPVSATPGRTKHFQTIHLTDKLILCDSPGLVMPTFAQSKAELVVNGTLPVDQLRDPLHPIELIYNRIDHSVLETVYGVTLPPAFSATEFLASLAFQRGFMSASGRPDGARASRIVIRHYTSGKLLYCSPPPADFIDPKKFRSLGLKCCFVENPSTSKRQLGNRIFERRTGINVEGVETSFDREFFGEAHVVNARNGRKVSPTDESKPWKKHWNGKRDKLRRRFVHLEA